METTMWRNVVWFLLFERRVNTGGYASIFFLTTSENLCIEGWLAVWYKGNERTPEGQNFRGLYTYRA